jgi:hypothetical protein
LVYLATVKDHAFSIKKTGSEYDILHVNAQISDLKEMSNQDNEVIYLFNEASQLRTNSYL